MACVSSPMPFLYNMSIKGHLPTRERLKMVTKKYRQSTRDPKRQQCDSNNTKETQKTTKKTQKDYKKSQKDYKDKVTAKEYNETETDTI